MWKLLHDLPIERAKYQIWSWFFLFLDTLASSITENLRRPASRPSPLTTNPKTTTFGFTNSHSINFSLRPLLRIRLQASRIWPICYFMSVHPITISSMCTLTYVIPWKRSLFIPWNIADRFVSLNGMKWNWKEPYLQRIAVFSCTCSANFTFQYLANISTLLKTVAPSRLSRTSFILVPEIGLLSFFCSAPGNQCRTWRIRFFQQLPQEITMMRLWA